MSFDWTLILAVAFAAIGIIEYIKGCLPAAPSWVWRVAQPAACLVLAVGFAMLPPFISTAALALALSQIGYQAIIETVKRRIGGVA